METPQKKLEDKQGSRTVETNKAACRSTCSLCASCCEQTCMNSRSTTGRMVTSHTSLCLTCSALLIRCVASTTTFQCAYLFAITQAMKCYIASINQAGKTQANTLLATTAQSQPDYWHHMCRTKEQCCGAGSTEHCLSAFFGLDTFRSEA